MLIALTQAARVQTVHLLMLKNISIGKDSICVWLGDNINGTSWSKKFYFIYWIIAMIFFSRT